MTAPAADALDLEGILQAMAAVVREPAFDAWRKAFVADNAGKFDYGEENRLEYTRVHALYEEGVEARLARALPEGVGMEAFCGALEAGLAEEKPAGAEAAMDVLLEASDFSRFKEMMLFEKSQMEETAAGGGAPAALEHLAPGAVPRVESLVAQCTQLQAAAEDQGWATVVHSSWMRIEKKAVPPEERVSPSEIFLRGTWSMSLSFHEACDLMFSFDDRRALYDANFRGAQAVKGDMATDNDCVVTAKVDYGLLLHLAGLPRSLTTRVLYRWDQPSPGQVTYVMAPWDPVGDKYDPTSVLNLKVGTIAPDPSDPNKCVMTTVETNKLGGLPKWLLGGLIHVTAPQLIRGLEQRYIKHVRDKGLSRQDVRAQHMGSARAPAAD